MMQQLPDDYRLDPESFYHRGVRTVDEREEGIGDNFGEKEERRAQ